MEDKIRSLYNLESFKEDEKGKLKIELSKDVSELASNLGVSLEAEGFDEFLNEMYSFLGETTGVFRRILKKDNINIYFEHGKLIIGN